LAELAKNEDLELFGSFSEADLILCRAGNCFFDQKQDLSTLDNLFICEHHRTRLSLKWNQKTVNWLNKVENYNHIRRRENKPVCSMPSSFSEHDGPAPFVQKYFHHIQKADAQAILKKKNLFVPIGLRKFFLLRLFIFDCSNL
jgi:hypothetical protein